MWIARHSTSWSSPYWALGSRDQAGGKIIVYPALHDLGLVRLVDMAVKLPSVAAHLDNGLWTKQAEDALLALAT